MKIAFPAGTLSYRGTHVALGDYAHFNQEVLGHESLIFIDEKNPGPEELLKKFRNRFECVLTDGWPDVSEKCAAARCDAAYVIKSGERDQQLVSGLPNLVHAVFPQPVEEQHGQVYAFVSEWLSKECSNGRLPFVPHMIHVPVVDSDLRGELGIPGDATVFGCYGGFDSFDIAFVQRVVREVCSANRNLWFVFMNIRPFAQQERVVFLPASTDPVRKRQFIQTCDAMLHARGVGESFGLACGEFSVSNKLVITYGLSPQRAHLHMLAGKALVYRGPAELRSCVLEFDRRWASQQDWDMYSWFYSPETVMRQFSEVFLAPQPLAEDGSAIRMNWTDQAFVEWAKVNRRLRSHSRKYHHRNS